MNQRERRHQSNGADRKEEQTKASDSHHKHGNPDIWPHMAACKPYKLTSTLRQGKKQHELIITHTHTHRRKINRTQDVLWVWRIFRGQNWVSASTHKHTPSPLRALHPKRHLLSFHLNTEHTSLTLCKDEGWNTKDMYRWCQQSPCFSLSSPSHSFKSSTGLRHRGSWVFPLSHPLTLPLFFSPPPPPPLLGKAGARRQAVLFLQRIDLTLPRLCFSWRKRPLRCTFC